MPTNRPIPRPITRPTGRPRKRFHLLNNVYFLHAARHGDYPHQAFTGGVPYETMGFRPGDEKTLKVPLDWIGVHYYERLAVLRQRRGHAARSRSA